MNILQEHHVGVCVNMIHQQTIELVEELLQSRINDILLKNEAEYFDKLPGLVESLKLIKERLSNKL